MTTEEIKELILVVQESGIAELEVQRGENRVRIRRVVTPSPEYVVSNAGGGQGITLPVQSNTTLEASPAAAVNATDEKTQFVKSPIVGTYYDSPSPGAAPFVNAGDRVAVGQVLCIIESMKLMNEIEAEVAGIVVRKLVDNGRPVEYGEALFAIQPH